MKHPMMQVGGCLVWLAWFDHCGVFQDKEGTSSGELDSAAFTAVSDTVPLGQGDSLKGVQGHI